METDKGSELDLDLLFFSLPGLQRVVKKMLMTKIKLKSVSCICYVFFRSSQQPLTIIPLVVVLGPKLSKSGEREMKMKSGG